MQKTLDRALSGLLFLGALGHMWGSSKFFAHQPMTLLYAESTGILTILLSALNFLRIERPGDQTFGYITTIGTFAYLIIAIEFGVVIGNPLDSRAVVFSLICVGLIVLGIMSITRSGRVSQTNLPIAAE